MVKLVRWYRNLYLGRSVRNSRLYYRFKLDHTRSFTGVYCISLSENSSELLDIISGENLRRNYRFMGEPLVVGLAGSRREAYELAGRIISDVYRKTGGTDVHAAFGQEKAER